MTLMRSVVVSLILIFHPCFAKGSHHCEAVLGYVHKHLSHQGVLKNSSGFVYVDVDDAYIHKLVTFIEGEGFTEPLYFGTADLVGAHITVVYPDEMKKYGIGEIQECGSTIHFNPKECQIVNPAKWKDQVYLIVVDAPELDQIRKKYGLPKREYEFHITIGVRPKTARAA